MKAVAVTSAEELAAAAGLLLVTGVPWLRFGRQSWRKMNRERLGRQRARVAERAVVEASLDDEAFSPELLLGTVREILDLAQRVWEDALDEVARPDGRLILSWADSVARAFGQAHRHCCASLSQSRARVADHQHRRRFPARLGPARRARKDLLRDLRLAPLRS